MIRLEKCCFPPSLEFNFTIVYKCVFYTFLNIENWRFYNSWIETYHLSQVHTYMKLSITRCVGPLCLMQSDELHPQKLLPWFELIKERSINTVFIPWTITRISTLNTSYTSTVFSSIVTFFINQRIMTQAIF